MAHAARRWPGGGRTGHLRARRYRSDQLHAGERPIDRALGILGRRRRRHGLHVLAADHGQDQQRPLVRDRRQRLQQQRGRRSGERQRPRRALRARRGDRCGAGQDRYRRGLRRDPERPLRADRHRLQWRRNRRLRLRRRSQRQHVEIRPDVVERRCMDGGVQRLAAVLDAGPADHGPSRRHPVYAGRLSRRVRHRALRRCERWLDDRHAGVLRHSRHRCGRRLDSRAWCGRPWSAAARPAATATRIA